MDEDMSGSDKARVATEADSQLSRRVVVVSGLTALTVGFASGGAVASSRKPGNQGMPASAPASDLEALERDLRRGLAGATLSLDRPLLDRLGLPAMPSFVLPELLTLADASISRSRSKLLVRGAFTLAPMGNVGFEIEVSERRDTILTVARWRFDPIDIGALARAARLPIPDLLDTLRANSIALDEGKTQLDVMLNGAASLNVGPVEAKLAAKRLALALSPAKLLEIEATLVLNGKSFPAIYSDDRLSFDASHLTLLDFIELFRVPLPKLPRLPLLTDKLKRFGLFSSEGGYRVAGEFNLGGIGPARFAIGSGQQDPIAAVVALYAPADLKLSRLSDLLAPFDVLTSVLSLGQPALVIASEDMKAWRIPDEGGGWTEIEAARGLQAKGELLLSGFGLEMIGALIALDRLPFVLPVGEDLSQLRLTAGIKRHLPILPGVLTIENIAVTISPQPLAFVAAGDATLTLFDLAVPPLRLGATLATGSYSFFLMAQAPLKNPLGLPFTIEEVGLQVDGPVLAYGFFGRISLQNRAVSVAAKFVGQAPTFLAAELQGDFSLVGLVEDLTGLKLPFSFEPKLTDAALYIVVDPRGTTIGERLYPRGIGIAGSLSFLGLGARLKLNADGSRLQAEGALNSPIRMAPLLEITGANGAATPSFFIDTNGSPIARMTGRVVLLGLTQEVAAVVGTDAIQFELHQWAGPVRADLASVLTSGRFAAKGATSCRVTGSIGPIRIGGVGPSLGKIHLDAAVSCETAISASGTNDAKTLFQASFEFAGLQIKLPELDLKLDTLERLPEAIFAFIRDNAAEIFADLLQDVSKWLEALARKLIDEVGDVARVLRDHFRQSTEAIARALRRALDNSVKETVVALERIGETAQNAAKALVAIGDSAEDVASALKDLGRNPTDVGQILRTLGKPAQEVASTLHKAGFPPEVAEATARALFPSSVIEDLPVPRVRIRVPDPVPRVRLRTRVRVRL